MFKGGAAPFGQQGMPKGGNFGYQNRGVPQQGAHSNIFVGNLPESTDEATLQQAFAAFGTVSSVHVMVRAGKTSALVKMAQVNDARAAITALSNSSNGWLVKSANYDAGTSPGRPKGGDGQGYGYGYGAYGALAGIYGLRGYAWDGYGGKGKGWGGKGGWSSGNWNSRRDEPEGTEPAPSDNLYVKFLSAGITDEEVRAAFAECGEVAALRVLRFDYALECAALVRMGTLEEAAAAREKLDGAILGGLSSTSELTCTKQMKKGEQVEDHVYCKGVPVNTTTEKVEAVFAKHGTVKWCSILPPSANQWRAGPTGAALVEMGSAEEATKAIEELNGRTLPAADLGMPIRVRYAAERASNNKSTPAEEATVPASAAEAQEAPAAPESL